MTVEEQIEAYDKKKQHEYRLQYYATHKDRYKVYRKTFYEKHRAEVCEKARNYYKKKKLCGTSAEQRTNYEDTCIISGFQEESK